MLKPRSSGPKPAPRAVMSPAVPSTGAPAPGRYVNAYWSGDALITIQRTEDGRVLRRSLPAEHACFLRAADVSPVIVRELRASSVVVGVREEPGGWLRVRWRNADVLKHVTKPKGLFDLKGIKTYEADVDPVRRWLTDTGAEIAKPRRCYFDLESDSRVPFARKSQARILCWSIVTPEGQKTARVLASDDDAAERELLIALWAELGGFDQVVAWNGERFDFDMIEARSKLHRINIDPRRWLWLDHMILFRRMNVSAAESGDEKQSMALDKVALAVTGQGKLEDAEGDVIDGGRSWELWSSGELGRRQLADYCVHDSELMRLIEERTGYIELLQTLCEACNVFPDTRGINPTQQVEGFLLRLGLARGMHFRTHFYVESSEKFAGAYVMEPSRKGILRDVHVADFAGLYPSIILTWNMSVETVRPDVRVRESANARPVYLSHLPLREFPLPEGHCAAPITDVVFDDRQRGILPEALEELRRLRKVWNKRKAELPPGTPEWKEADRRATAYKVAANTFYGVIGSPFSRFFERAVAESVAQGGVWLIQETIKAAEERGLRVVYGDTDSIFAIGCSRAEFEAFVRWCNAELYPRLLREKGCSRNFVELAYEKAFDRVVFVTKKRYAGKWAHYKGTAATADSKPEIKGLEFKRGDTLRLARQLQREIIYRILGCECDASEDPADYERILDGYMGRVLAGDLPLEEVVISKRLTKAIRDYVRKPKKTPPYPKLVGEEVSVSYTEAECVKCRAPMFGTAEACDECGGARRKRGARVSGTVAHVTETTIAVSAGLASVLVPIESIGEVVTFAAQPPHVMVARALAARGRDVGKGVRIEYVVIDGADSLTCIPAEDWAGEYDRFYLWERLVYEPTQRLLEAAFPGAAWSRWANTRPPKPKPEPKPKPPAVVKAQARAASRRAARESQTDLFASPKE